jgi:hypothetical protein
MKEYTVNNKSFTTICSVHDEINNIVLQLQKEHFPSYIINELEKIKELTSVAKEMGQNMEGGLQVKGGFFYFPDVNNFHRFIYSQNPNPEEEND